MKSVNKSLKNQTEIQANQIESLNQTINEVNQQKMETDQQLLKAEIAKGEIEEKFDEMANNCLQREEELFELTTKYEQLLESSSFYIGHRADHVDFTLANYIKQFPEREKFKIMFLRESAGVYQFGQRKVFIKIEAGNQIKVRVGGGFMHIDEFLDQYTDLELDRLERRDVV